MRPAGGSRRGSRRSPTSGPPFPRGAPGSLWLGARGKVKSRSCPASPSFTTRCPCPAKASRAGCVAGHGVEPEPDEVELTVDAPDRLGEVHGAHCSPGGHEARRCPTAWSPCRRTMLGWPWDRALRAGAALAAPRADGGGARTTQRWPSRGGRKSVHIAASARHSDARARDTSHTATSVSPSLARPLSMASFSAGCSAPQMSRSGRQASRRFLPSVPSRCRPPGSPRSPRGGPPLGPGPSPLHRRPRRDASRPGPRAPRDWRRSPPRPGRHRSPSRHQRPGHPEGSPRVARRRG